MNQVPIFLNFLFHLILKTRVDLTFPIYVLKIWWSVLIEESRSSIHCLSGRCNILNPRGLSNNYFLSSSNNYPLLTFYIVIPLSVFSFFKVSILFRAAENKYSEDRQSEFNYGRYSPWSVIAVYKHSIPPS